MPIALPDAHGMAMLGLTILALVLFSRDRIPLETSCLIVLALLVIGFQVFPYSHDGAVIRPTEFFVGFGPRLWSTVRGETEYGIRALPAGAFVRIIGLNSMDEAEPESTGTTKPSKAERRRQRKAKRRQRKAA